MKQKKFGRVSTNIILITIILIAAILTTFYGINIPKFLEKSNLFLNSNNLQKAKKADLVRCIDGDTVQLKVKKQTIKVRLLGIDTPEIKRANKKGELYGQEASEYTCNSLKEAKEIKIQYEKGLTNKDKYKRHLVWLYVDNKLLQEELIKNGYAKVRYIYARYTYTDKLLQYQKEAQNNHLRIWNQYKPTTHKNELYYVVFNNDGSSKTVEVKEGKTPVIIENPHKRGYTFTGWIKNNELYDLSKPIKSNIVLKARYAKRKY